MINKIIKFLILFDNFSFEKGKKKKYCIIENNLENSLISFTPKKLTALISIREMNIFILIKLILRKKKTFYK